MDIMRKIFTVGFAGVVIEIDTVSSCVCVLCRDYFLEGNPDIKVKITKADIENELKVSPIRKKDYVSAELTAAYRKIVEAALDYNFFLMHGAAIADGEESFIFSAPSGTGKTTHIKLWLQNSKNTMVINGDKPLIRILDNSVVVCGTPWSGSEHMNTNIVKPLKSIVFMERGDDNFIEEISFSQAYLKLLEQTYIPREEIKAKKVLSLLLSLNGKLSFYRFRCNNFKEDCFDVAYNTLRSGNQRS